MGDEPLKYQQNGQTLSYICESSGGSPVKTHRIVVSRKGWSVLHYILLLVFLCFFSTLIVENGAEVMLPFVMPGFLLFYWARSKRVVEEVVVVLPTLGVQLETVYHNRKVHRRFVPLQKIVAPIINEGVSPVTCYFYLALLLRGEDNMVLTFLGLRPPLKMLVPIWRSLCELFGTSQASETISKGPLKDGTHGHADKGSLAL